MALNLMPNDVPSYIPRGNNSRGESSYNIEQYSKQYSSEKNNNSTRYSPESYSSESQRQSDVVNSLMMQYNLLQGGR